MAIRVNEIRSVSAPEHVRSAGERTPQMLSFSRTLSDMNQEDYRRHIYDLVDQITQQGDLVSKRADITEFQRYRGMITSLINETVSNAYAFEKNGVFDSTGRHRVFANIKKINVALDELAEEVLKEQSDNIKILSSVDDIRGMLVDLLI